MTISWNEGLAVLLRVLSHGNGRAHTETESRLNLNAEELRELQRQHLEQDLAREHVRTSTALQKPFNGLL